MKHLTSEQLAYEHAKAVGWNEAIKAAAHVARHTFDDSEGIALAIEKLDKSMQATDD